MGHDLISTFRARLRDMFHFSGAECADNRIIFKRVALTCWASAQAEGLKGSLSGSFGPRGPSCPCSQNLAKYAHEFSVSAIA